LEAVARQPAKADRLEAQAQRLYEAGEWPAVLQLAEAIPDPSPEILYFHGLSLAQLERWEEARQVLLRGQRDAPGDKRFYQELAGVYFRQRRYSEAKPQLRKAISIDPADGYLRDFLATVYFLEGNLEAAIKQWNFVNKPLIRDISFDPAPKLDPLLLSQAVFSPHDQLRLSEYRRTERILENLGIFARHRFDFVPRQEGDFNVVFRSSTLDPWEGPLRARLLYLGRGLPYQTAHLDFINLNESALNVSTTLRWDSKKQRMAANLTSPLGQDPSRLASGLLDLRSEEWDLSDHPGFGGLLEMRWAEAVVGTESIPHEKWFWGAELRFSYRDFKETLLQPGDEALFETGGLLKQRFRAGYVPVRLPERHLTLELDGLWELGRFWSDSGGLLARAEGGAALDWVFRPEYFLGIRARAGRLDGAAPFDQLYRLGVDRDIDLPLRGHSGTREGRKGNSPIGSSFVLTNLDVSRIVYQHPLLQVRLGPFLDSGKVFDPSGLFGPERWLWDAGLESRVRLLGTLTLSVSYGRNLQTGESAFFTTLTRRSPR
jgi:hypothetical protein